MRIMSSAEHLAVAQKARLEERTTEYKDALARDLEGGPTMGWPDRRTDTVAKDEREARAAYLTHAEEAMREAWGREAAETARRKAAAALNGR